MQSNFEFDYSEFNQFADSIAHWDELAIQSAKKAMPVATDYLLEKMPEYPQETLGRLEPPDGITWLKTDQQRKWFFAAVRNGDIKGWKWVDAEYTVTTTLLSRPRGTYKLREEFEIGDIYYKPGVQKKVLVNPAHPEKIGGARTGNLGRAKGRDIVSDERTVSGIIGFDSTIAPYAPWVVGSDFPGENDMYQAQIHVDVWWQFGSIIDENLDPAWQKFDEAFWDEFSKRIENYESK